MITDQGQNDTLGQNDTKRQRVQVDITKVNRAKEAASGSYKAFASIDWNTFAMAKTFVERTKGSLIYIRHEEDNRGSGNMYVYHENRWRQDNNCEIVKVIYTRTMTAFFEPTISIVDRYVLLLQQLEVDATNEEIKNELNKWKGRLMQVKSIQHKCGVGSEINSTVQIVRNLLASELHTVEFDTCAEQSFNLHFENCVLDLTTKTTRPRTKEDYVTKILDYKYMPFDQVNEQAHSETRQFFEKIQPDQEQRDFTLSYLAYGITGDTSQQIMKMNIGYTASNGKSTEVAIHHEWFKGYTTMLDKVTLKQGYEKRHKQFLELIRSPIRLAYIEELDRERLDADVLKHFVDGKKLSVELLYGTKAVGNLQSKLITCSNKDPVTDADEGIMRRIMVQHYTSKFIAGVQDDDINHNYGLVTGFEHRFNDPHYKNAYLHLLLEHLHINERTCQFYIPEAARTGFKEIIEESDEFIRGLEMGFIITKCKDNVVSKAELEAHFRFIGNCTWTEILPDLKRLGLTYDRDRHAKYNGKNTRGVVRGLKVRPEAENDDPPPTEWEEMQRMEKLHQKLMNPGYNPV